MAHFLRQDRTVIDLPSPSVTYLLVHRQEEMSQVSFLQPEVICAFPFALGSSYLGFQIKQRVISGKALLLENASVFLSPPPHQVREGPGACHPPLHQHVLAAATGPGGQPPPISKDSDRR